MMGSRFPRLVLALVCLLCAACSQISNGPNNRPDKVSLAEIRFDIPKASRWVLDNGLVVSYYFNDEVPVVRGKFYFPGGALFDRSGIAGLASATGVQMREGAIPGYRPEQLDKHLDALAASIESSFGDEFGTVGFFSLAEDFEEVFELFRKVVLTPSFDKNRLALWQKLSLDGIRRRKDSADTMSQMAFTDLVYGEDSLFSRSATRQSIIAISPQKMREFHRKFVRPDGSYLAITGAIPAEQVKKAVQQAFGSWPRGEEKRPSLPLIGHVAQPGIYVLERDFDQATVLIGHRGPPRHTPDIYEMQIYNRVFGYGGFGSMLFREIRSNLGLAYSVYGGLWPGPVEGVFQISIGTRTSQAVKAIRKSIELSEVTKQQLPSDNDFEGAKSAVEKSFVFKFADPSYIANRSAILDLLGYPRDYDQTYLKNLASIGPAQVQEVGQRWVRPDDFIIVVVGRVSAKEIAKDFKGQRKVFRLGFDTKPKVLGLVEP